jgi:UDP-GlcNAc:undecaprenyl-phosphate GlcNAc-1-phosphate transferase
MDLGNLLGFGNLYLGPLGIPITIFMVVGVCNAFNMLDGMDGIVGFVILVCSSAISLIAYLNDVPEVLFLGSILCLVFLLFNLGLLGKKWKLFLGDSGSMWLGFITAWFLVILSQGEDRLFLPVTALWLVLLPLIDALSTFLSRLWNRKSLFLGDRNHIHHILLDAGLEKWKVLLIFLIISIISAGFGVFANLNSISEPTQFYGFLTIWFFYFLLVKFPLTNNRK